MTEAAQFSVYRSPSKNPARPFVVVLQSNDFARMPTRLVAPLVRLNAFPLEGRDHPRVAPILMINGAPYVFNPLDVATIAVFRLGEFVTSYAEDDETKHRIQDALDAVLKPY